MGPMTNLGLSYDAKTNAQTDQATLDAASAGSGDLTATPEGVDLAGESANGLGATTEHGDVGLSTDGGGTLSATPDGADAGGALVGDVSANDAAASADLTGAASDGGLSLDGALDAMVDVMGALLAQASASLGAMLGL